MDTAKLDEIIKTNGNTRAGIIAILHEIQAQYNYLPEEPLRYIGIKLNTLLIDLYSIVSFYHTFSLTPRGKHLMQCCLGTICHMCGLMGWMNWNENWISKPTKRPKTSALL